MAVPSCPACGKALTRVPPRWLERRLGAKLVWACLACGKRTRDWAGVPWQVLGKDEPPTPTERRALRVPLVGRVQIKAESLESFLEAHAGNISEGGIFVKTENPLPVGKVIVLTVTLPEGDRLIEASGKVAWSRLPGDPGGEPAGMGITFTGLSEKSLELIRAIVTAESPE